MNKNDYIICLERKEDSPVVENLIIQLRKPLNLVLMQCVLKEILTFMKKADKFD